MKESLIRPGKAALDYISGKRIRYYNVFYLIVLLIGLQLFLVNYYEHLQTIYYPEIHEQFEKKAQNTNSSFFSDYGKIMFLTLIPLFALTSFIIFRRKKLNLSEHFIISGMIFLGVMIITIFSTMISFIDFLGSFSTMALIIDRSTPIILVLYISYGYYNAFRLIYNKSSLFLRIIAFDILLLLEIGFFISIVYFLFNPIL